MQPQEKWKLEAQNEGEAHTKNINKKTYHWWPRITLWDVHKPDDLDNIKTGKDKTPDSNTTQKL